MDRLWALKKDFDPFPPRIWLRANWFAIIRCTVYRCPYCQWIFKITWGPSNSFLGSGERTCWRCKEIFWDGSEEWPEMGRSGRMRFVLPISMAGFLGAFLLIAGLYSYFVITRNRHFEVGELIFFAVFFFPILCWSLFRMVQVLRSIRRYNTRGTYRTT
jgi:hypothetical protein